ncbi:hypothetical protein GGR16_001723 [Chelatococcus caeni]|uniref:Uncharacterized protein n=1 Tax=Chelatococcus caeni TaxID=1348468 RepID=A0A840C2P3_9HYPH|nr:hypothetical protein [Chelatococcus caeni]MBB4016717.1 hypothetical protein [Chelatococcus caeni]
MSEGLIKPKRHFTRGLTIGTLVPAWTCIAWAMWLGDRMAEAVVPPMMMLIAATLGVYQGVGHLDLRGQLGAGRRGRPPYDRDDRFDLGRHDREQQP